MIIENILEIFFYIGKKYLFKDKIKISTEHDKNVRLSDQTTWAGAGSRLATLKFLYVFEKNVHLILYQIKISFVIS